MTPEQRKAMEMALEALEVCEQHGYIQMTLTRESITALRQALDEFERYEDEKFKPDWMNYQEGFAAGVLEGREQIKQQPCKYGNEPSSCTSDPMNCQCALDAALEQCHHGVDEGACKECYEPSDDSEARYKSVIDDVRKLWNDKREREQQPAIVDRAEEAFDAAKQRDWVGLTDQEVKHEWERWRANVPRYSGFAKGIEAKLKEKNGGKA